MRFFPASPQMQAPPDPDDEPRLAENRRWLRLRARRALGKKLRGILDSEDVAQEAELRALRDLKGKRFSNGRAFRAWLGTIVRNVAAQAARRPPGASEDVDWTAVSGRERTPSSAARREEQRFHTKRLLARLPERDRKLVALRLVDELPFRDVADRLDVSEPHARMIFSRSIQKLRELAGQQGNPGSR